MAAAISVRRDLHDRVIAAGLAFAVWRIVLFARLPPPDPLAAEGAACAGYYTRALLLGCSFVCGLFPPLALLLGWKAFAPGAAFISGYLPGLDRAGRQPPDAVGIGHHRCRRGARSASGRRSAAPRDCGRRRAYPAAGIAHRERRSAPETARRPERATPFSSTRFSRHGEVGRRARRASATPARPRRVRAAGRGIHGQGPRPGRSSGQRRVRPSRGRDA